MVYAHIQYTHGGWKDFVYILVCPGSYGKQYRKQWRPEIFEAAEPTLQPLLKNYSQEHIQTGILRYLST